MYKNKKGVLMDFQMIVLITLSVMLVIKIVYLVFLRQPEQRCDKRSHSEHHDHKW